MRIIADSTEDDLELVSEDSLTESEKIFSRQVNRSIKNILVNRGGFRQEYNMTKFLSHKSA